MSNKSGILPNLLFDITAKDKEDIDEIIAMVGILGYKITLVYMVQSTNVAKVNNRLRDRSVPTEVLLGTHDGSFKTVIDYLKKPNSLDAAWVYLGYDNRFYDVSDDENKNRAYNLKKNSDGSFYLSSDVVKKIKELRTRKIDSARLEKLINGKRQEILKPELDQDGNPVPTAFSMADLKQIYADLKK